MQGMHGVGMLGSGSQLRPGGIHQQRPLQQPSVRPTPSSISQSPSSQVSASLYQEKYPLICDLLYAAWAYSFLLF